MATAMVTLTWCDRHLTDKDEEVPGSSMPPVNGAQLDLCDECALPLMEALALYERYGSKGKRTPQLAAVKRRAAAPQKPARPDQTPVEGGLPCPQPDCESVLKNRSSLGAHARQDHGVTLGELEGKPITHTCDVKGCGKGFTTLQGFTLHQRKHARERAAAS